MVSLVLFVAAFWIALLLVFFVSQGTSVGHYLRGEEPPLPPGVGSWSPPVMDANKRLLKESRFLLPEGTHRSRHLLLQVRYRDPSSGKIVEVGSERRVTRREAHRLAKVGELGSG